MKVCGKKDVHVPGCSDCEELEGRVEAVEECCEDAQTKIEDKADTTYVDENVDTIEGQITEMSTALNERIDNIITSSEPSITTLWEGDLALKGDSVQLSDDVDNYDFLDVYYKTSYYSDRGYYGYIRVPSDEYENYTTTIGGIDRPSTGTGMRQYLTMLSFVDDTATIQDIRRWYWDGNAASDAEDSSYLTGIGIYRIDGVKISGVDAEIADARVGVDGTVYPSLGDAIRGQIQDTRDMIPQLVKTVQGNPIVIDDAFGEVKNLDVELTPIQDLHGYSKPWSAGAGKNKFSNILSDYDNASEYGLSVYIAMQFPQNTIVTVSTDAPTGYIWAGVDRATDYGRVYAGSPITRTLTDGVLYVGILKTDKAGALAYKNQIEIGNTVTTYEPYSNICPITGHDSVEVTDTGANQWDEVTELGAISDTTGENTSSNTSLRSKNYIRVMPSTSYYVAGLTSGILRPEYYDANKGFISAGYWQGGTSNNPQTTPANCYYMRFRLAASYGTTYNNDISVNYPSTDTTYHAYYGQSKTVTLPHTVYGAGVGVTSGSGKDKYGIVTLQGALNENWQLYNGYNGFRIDMGTYGMKSGSSQTGWSDSFEVLSEFTSLKMGIALGAQNTYMYMLNVRSMMQDITDVATWKTYLASHPLTVVYPLATPTDLSTTPTDITLYNGDNVISSDGDMELSYVQDMAIVIRKIENQL